MKLNKSQLKNGIFLLVILLLIVPQTRQPIQVFIQKGMALFSPSIIDEESRIQLTNYDWKLIDSAGNSFNFNSAKNKVIVLNFWATWCPPCIAEMPSFERLYQDYNDEVLFLFVSNETKEKVNSFVNKNNYSFPLYASKGAQPDIFNVSSIPRTFLIDKNGTIIIDKVGAANWNSDSVRKEIDELLSN